MRRTRPSLVPAVAAAALAVAGCTGGSPADVPVPTKSVAAAVGTVVLSKADGWRPALGAVSLAPSYDAVVEIAYDEASARRAWAENAPVGGPLRSGAPVAEGLYGRFEDVDLARQRLVVVSAGQSGSCPGWVTGVAVRPGGAVEVALGETAPDQTCSADYNPYRTVLAVDRDRLPAASDLTPPPTVLVNDREVGSDVPVVAYPFDPAA